MIGCIIQARMGSSRLPGKAMKKIHDKIPILEFQQNQLKLSKRIDKIIIATTILESDDHIANFCESNNLECFRGESEDVLDRYYHCAKKFNFPIIVRLTSDNPHTAKTHISHMVTNLAAGPFYRLLVLRYSFLF